MTLPALIPCAGKGTRLRPVTRYLSKPMLPLGATPVIKFVLAEAVDAGCDPIVVIGSPGDDELKTYLSTLDYSDRIEWVTQKEPRGLADALLKGYSSIDYEGPTAVLLPDNVILDGEGIGDLISPDLTTESPIWGKTMVSEQEAQYFGNSGDYRPDSPNPGGRERVVSLQEKEEGHYIDRQLDWPAPRLVGRVILPPRFFKLTREAEPGPETDEIDDVPLYRRMLESTPGHAVPLSGTVFDMGEPENYLRLSSYYFRSEAKRHHD